MKFKKIVISIITMVIFLMTGTSQYIYATDTALEEEEEKGWVQEAFDAANSFLKEKDVEDELGIFGTLLEEFKNFINGANMVLLVLLASLSAIALALVGVKYIMAGNSPKEKGDAQKSLRAVFTGMIYGFGAYIIWTLAMGVITLIMGAFSGN